MGVSRFVQARDVGHSAAQPRSQIPIAANAPRNPPPIPRAARALHNRADRLSGKRLDGLGFADPLEEGAGVHPGGGQPRGERLGGRLDEGVA